VSAVVIPFPQRNRLADRYYRFMLTDPRVAGHEENGFFREVAEMTAASMTEAELQAQIARRRSELLREVAALEAL
jgi:hypothetical protein